MQRFIKRWEKLSDVPVIFIVDGKPCSTCGSDYRPFVESIGEYIRSAFKSIWGFVQVKEKTKETACGCFGIFFHQFILEGRMPFTELN